METQEKEYELQALGPCEGIMPYTHLTDPLDILGYHQRSGKVLCDKCCLDWDRLIVS